VLKAQNYLTPTLLACESTQTDPLTHFRPDTGITDSSGFTLQFCDISEFQRHNRYLVICLVTFEFVIAITESILGTRDTVLKICFSHSTN